jgi:hypothetical protein
MTHCLRESLTVAPDCPAPTQKQLIDAIQVFITYGAGGSTSAIANELQFSSTLSVNNGRTGYALPSLEMLMRLCYAFGLSLLASPWPKPFQPLN